MNTVAEEAKALRTLLIAAGIGLMGVVALVAGLCMFLGASAPGSDRLPGEIAMTLGAIVGLTGMVVTAYNSER